MNCNLLEGFLQAFFHFRLCMKPVIKFMPRRKTPLFGDVVGGLCDFLIAIFRRYVISYPRIYVPFVLAFAIAIALLVH